MSGNDFVKGRTDNHLTFTMVDATDFATPESALSAAIKIKIYGLLRSATGVNFVSSGTGSLTNDIQHVGASVLGLYNIALVKADLSDASAAWYDQYVIALSATGAAYQELVVNGGIDTSKILSALLLLESTASDAASAAAQGNSRILLTQSMASDAYSAAIIIQSRLSDFDSRLVSDISDVLSAVAVANSRVLLAQSLASDAVSAANVGNSRILLVQSRLSDFDSRMVSDVSDIRSMLTYLSAALSDTDSAADSQYSDLLSRVGVGNSRALLAQSLASDAVSAANVGNSRILLVQSRLSDLDSRLTSDVSDILSNVLLTQSMASDAASAAAQANSRVLLGNSMVSDLASRIASDVSDILSALTVAQSMASDAHSAAAQGNSRVLLVQSRLSDLDSRLVSDVSDLLSAVRGNSDAISAIKVQTDKMTFDASNHIAANIKGIGDDEIGAANLAKTTRVICRGTADVAASTTSIPTSAFTPAGAVADQFKGRVIIWDADTTTAALRGQATDITASSNASNPTLTVTALTTAPANGDTFSVV